MSGPVRGPVAISAVLFSPFAGYSTSFIFIYYHYCHEDKCALGAKARNDSTSGATLYRVCSTYVERLCNRRMMVIGVNLTINHHDDTK